MLSYQEALAHYQACASPKAAALLTLDQAQGLALAQDVSAAFDVPELACSAMDGWAIQAQDAQAPGATLQLIGEIFAGQDPSTITLAPGQAARIATGAALPAGADAVVRREDGQASEGKLHVHVAITPGQDVRAPAEQLNQGHRIASRGQRLSAGLLATLAMQGITQVQVYPAPRVEVLTCGDELIAPGQPKTPWQHYQGNSAMLLAALQRLGAHVVSHQHLPDDQPALATALAAALPRADLVITTGGASVGDKDLWRACAQQLNISPRFWKVAQRPGKPLFFAPHHESLWLGLPGTPYAVLSALAAHVAPLIGLLAGAAPQPMLRLPLATPCPTHPSMTKLEPVRFHDEGPNGTTLEPLGHRPQHEQMALAQAIAIIPPSATPLDTLSIVQAAPLY